MLPTTSISAASKRTSSEVARGKQTVGGPTTSTVSSLRPGSISSGGVGVSGMVSGSMGSRGGRAGSVGEGCSPMGMVCAEIGAGIFQTKSSAKLTMRLSFLGKSVRIEFLKPVILHSTIAEYFQLR